MIERQIIKDKLKEHQIREHMANVVGKSGYSHTEIQKTPLGEKIIIYTSAPGLIVGGGGRSIKELTLVLKKKFGLENPQIEVSEIGRPYLNPRSVAKDIVSSFERFGPRGFKYTGYKILKNVMAAGAQGAEIVITGRGIPSTRSKRWRFTSVDPVKDNHAYSYVDNNPLGFVDLNGKNKDKPNALLIWGPEYRGIQDHMWINIADYANGRKFQPREVLNKEFDVYETIVYSTPEYLQSFEKAINALGGPIDFYFSTVHGNPEYISFVEGMLTASQLVEIDLSGYFSSCARGVLNSCSTADTLVALSFAQALSNSMNIPLQAPVSLTKPGFLNPKSLEYYSPLGGHLGNIIEFPGLSSEGTGLVKYRTEEGYMPIYVKLVGDRLGMTKESASRLGKYYGHSSQLIQGINEELYDISFDYSGRVYHEDYDLKKEEIIEVFPK